MNYGFEVVVILVSEVDNAKDFYQALGWRLDANYAGGLHCRLVQLTPPGSAWKSTPTPTSSTHAREPSYLAGRPSALDARLEDAHMGCSMQNKAWASDADQGIGQ